MLKHINGTFTRLKAKLHLIDIHHLMDEEV